MAMSVLILLLPLVAASCRAADSTQPASQPTTLQTSARVVPAGGGWSIEIKLSNPTDHPLTIGRYSGFIVTRSDTNPPTVVAKSPDHVMSPHFRMVIPPGASQSTTVALIDQPLPPGPYHVAVSLPRDVLTAPVEADFTVSAPQTGPAHP